MSERCKSRDGEQLICKSCDEGSREQGGASGGSCGVKLMFVLDIFKLEVLWYTLHFCGNH